MEERDTHKDENTIAKTQSRVLADVGSSRYVTIALDAPKLTTEIVTKILFPVMIGVSLVFEARGSFVGSNVGLLRLCGKRCDFVLKNHSIHFNLGFGSWDLYHVKPEYVRCIKLGCEKRTCKRKMMTLLVPTHSRAVGAIVAPLEAVTAFSMPNTIVVTRKRRS